MLPFLRLGLYEVSTYGLLIALAVFSAGMYSLRRLLWLDYPRGLLPRGLLVTIVAGFGAGVLVMSVTNSVLSPAFGVKRQGLSIVWVVAGGAVAAMAYARLYHIPLLPALDRGVVPLPLGQAIGRLGCAAAGCCYGREAGGWLALYLPDQYGVWLHRYPTQLLAAGADLLIFGALLTLDHRIRRARMADFALPEGALVAAYLALLSLKRFLLAFLRDGPTPVLGPINSMHLSALVGLLIAVSLTLWLRYRCPPRTM